MGNMSIGGGRGRANGIGGSAVCTEIVGGRLVVPPAYMQSARDLAVPVNVNSVARFEWTQEVDQAFSSLSIYLKTVTTTGDLACMLLAGGGIESTLTGTVIPSGSSNGVWKRLTLDNVVQLHRGKRYHLLFMPADMNVSVSLSCNRQNPAPGSGLVPECQSSVTTDQGATWTAIVKDNRPALLNVVLNSTPNHSPQLVYGRSNGKDIALYDGLKWESREIPEAGISFSCEGLTAETLYNIYLHDNAGTLSLEASTAPRMIIDGIEVKSEAPSHRYLGLVCPIERQTGLQAPIKVSDRMGVYNAYNRRPTFVGKPAPYAVSTEGSGSDTSWVAISDFTAEFITGDQCRLASDFSLASVTGTRLTILLDGAALSDVPVSWTTRTSDLISVHAEFMLSEGCHTVCPAASGWPVFDYSLYNPIYGTSSLTGEIMA
jgi:hypothetical protein